MLCSFSVVCHAVVLGHQRQARVVDMVVVVAQASQTVDRMVAMEEAILLIIGMTA